MNNEIREGKKFGRARLLVFNIALHMHKRLNERGSATLSFANASSKPDSLRKPAIVAVVLMTIAVAQSGCNRNYGPEQISFSDASRSFPQSTLLAMLIDHPVFFKRVIRRDNQIKETCWSQSSFHLGKSTNDAVKADLVIVRVTPGDYVLDDWDLRYPIHGRFVMFTALRGDRVYLGASLSRNKARQDKDEVEKVREELAVAGFSPAKNWVVYQQPDLVPPCWVSP